MIYVKHDNAIVTEIVPIPGTRRLERLEENLGALAVTLTAEELNDIAGAAYRIPVKGARYPDSSQKLIDR
ncbi:MAG: hypothetical protein WAL29_00935 [Bacteroidales bacterium]